MNRSRSIRLITNTPNPIESTFWTLCPRHAKTNGSRSATACETMVYKRMICASTGWQAFKGSTLLREVIAGVTFVEGVKKTNAWLFSSRTRLTRNPERVGRRRPMRAEE